MNLYNLWFIKYDSLFFKEYLDFSQMKRILRNRKSKLDECYSKSIQLYLYEIIKFLESFFNFENILGWLQFPDEIFSQKELFDFQQKTMEFKLIIECQKIYCQQFWLNKQLCWDVQVRILACLCRLYLFVVKVHYFLVGEVQSVWQKQKKKKLLIPIQHLEKFVNEIYIRLLKLDEFYYQNEYPYLIQIHELLVNFKKILFEFPQLLHCDISLKFKLFQVILIENKKKLDKFICHQKFYPKNNFVKDNNNKKLYIKKTKSVNYCKKKFIEINGFINFVPKNKPKLSLQNSVIQSKNSEISDIQDLISSGIFQKIYRTQKRFSMSTFINSNSDHASSPKEPTLAHMFEFNKQQIMTRSSKEQSLGVANAQKRIKAKSRRIIHRKISSKKIAKSPDNILIEFDLDFVEQKQQNNIFLRDFYQQLPYPISYDGVKISLQQQETSIRKLKYQGIASKFKIAEKKLQAVLTSTYEFIKLKARPNKNCIC